MKNLLLATAAIGLALPALAQTQANPDESTVPMDQVPQEVMTTAEENAGGVTFEQVSVENEDGTEIYEFAATKEGMGYEVDVLADGTLEEIEEEIAMDALPEAVSSALEAELAGFEPEYIEKSTREDGSTVVFEFEGQHEGQAIDAEINEDGSNFVMNEDMAG